MSSLARRSLSLLLKQQQQQQYKIVSALTKQSVQKYHVTKKAENELIVGGLVVATSAMAIRYGLQAIKDFQANQPPKPEGEDATVNATEGAPAAEKKKKDPKNAANNDTSTADSPFASWFAKNFYDGGFEDKMSKREAALILGVRESATAERIKEAHRKILLLNHPDRGGSAHLAAKINEAKELLMKGKQ